MQSTLAHPAQSTGPYQLRLPVFEGPLDVLLRLIEREQLPISDISLLAVLDQFVVYTRQLVSAPPDVIAEFAVVAGRLALLKSRSLLPRPPKPLDDAELPDLVLQLAEYRAVKSAAHLLAERQQSGLGAFGRGEGVAWPPAETIPLSPRPPSALARAMRRWRDRAPLQPSSLPARGAVSLREMIDRVMAVLEREGRAPFDRVRATCTSRQDIAVAFLALLTLLRRQRVGALQGELFGPITMVRGEVWVIGDAATGDTTIGDFGDERFV